MPTSGRSRSPSSGKLRLADVKSDVCADEGNRYASGRGDDWVKKTCAQRETLTIAGFALDGKKWDGIYLGRRKGNDLIYAGKVDHGFDKTQTAELRKRLTPLIRKSQPYTRKIAYKGIWVEPNCLRKSNTARSLPREKFGTPIREDLCSSCRFPGQPSQLK